MTPGTPGLHVRWLGRVPYSEALTLQRAWHAHPGGDWLMLCEHPHVYTLGVRTDPANVLPGVATSGAEVVRTDRGGDVTYHGPGQLVGYPLRTLPTRNGGLIDTPRWVHEVEDLVIDAVRHLGVGPVGRLGGFPGVWVDPEGPAPRKLAAIGVRIGAGRSLHGFALNVDPDLSMFGHIVPCGIAEYPVTSLAAEGCDAGMRDVVDVVADLAARRWSTGGVADRVDVAWRHRPGDLSAFSRGAGPGQPVRPDAHRHADQGTGKPEAVPVTIGTTPRRAARLAAAGVEGGLDVAERKPEWLRARLNAGERFQDLRRKLRSLELVTVCEEAGCPNISECWGEGTATFMINGERCTRACGFCLVDTRHPVAPDPGEPARVAEAVDALGLRFAVVTAVARDDLADGGAAGFVATIDAIRARTPSVEVEVLIPDCKGNPEALDAIFAARPAVVNHNLETVGRLQRAVRPSAGYARSLAVLARAKQAGCTTKSGLVVGLGETDDEVGEALVDLAGVGVDIVTIGQYLRPTSNHLPVARWVPPETFTRYAAIGRTLGIGHVEASPLTRSSYHARHAAHQVAPATVG